MVKKFCCKFISIVMIMIMVMLACISLVYADGIIYQAKFQPGMWDREDWIEVKSPRWDFIGGWVQKEGWIENLMPEDHKPGTMVLECGFFAYASMVHREKVCLRERVIVSSTMAFEYDQAPQIVIALELGKSEEGFPEHREHFEVVMWSRGINIWHHIIEDGKPRWSLVAYSRFPLEAGKPYEMVVTIDRVGYRAGGPARKGRWITVEVGGHKFGYYESSLPDTAYLGIIGYASRNRFYDFRIKRQ